MTERSSPSFARSLRRRLLAWYDERRRDLPWRNGADPYRVWVSEIMLQQTRAQAVVPYFERWIERFPTLDDLVRADREEVLRAWSGLGYYARARNLHRAAILVRDRHDGELPRGTDALRALPGIGEYTAGAIASIAFGAREPAVDGNARRVLCRLHDLASLSPAKLRRRAARIVDPNRPGDFNQALMELGATVCTPRSPDCGACPLAALCLARRRGNQELWPTPRRGGSAPSFLIGTAVVVAGSGRVLLARRPEDGLLGGLWEFPGQTVREGQAPSVAARRAARALLGPRAPGPRAAARLLARIDHAYSHRRHTYHAYRIGIREETAPDVRGPEAMEAWTDAAWAAPSSIADFPLSTAQRRIAFALSRRNRRQAMRRGP